MFMFEIFKFIDVAFEIYTYMIIIYVFMSWVPSAMHSSIGQLLGKLVEPYLGLFRKIIPPIGMIDITPIIAVFLLAFIKIGLLKVLSYILF